MTSAVPKTLDELITEAQRLSRELGAIPSQNKLKAALHVRAERAKAVLTALKESGFDPTEPDTQEPAPRWLHAVPHSGTAEPAPTGGISEAGFADEFTGITGTLLVEPDAAMPDLMPVDHVAAPSTDVEGAGEPAPTTPPTAAPAARKVWRGRNPWRLSTSAEVIGAAPVPDNRPVRRWPIVLLAAPAFVAIWSGWVGLGVLTGFGLVHPLPGIADGFTLNSAITLPVGVETYAAYALRVWLAAGTGADQRARAFAKWSAIGSLVLGAAGQVAYHLLTAWHVTAAPWPITTAVSCLPVIVLGFGGALAHLQHPHHRHAQRTDWTETGR